MKLTMKLLVLIFGVLILTKAVYAESPREQLKQMVEQLKKDPSDTVLCEKIIRLALTIKPAPAVPEEAERHMARGTAAFKGAKSISDYQDAVREFEQATLAAPWYGDAYYNLGVARDKAESYEAALRSLKFAQLALPNSGDVKQLIYEVEYRNEKANSPEAKAAKEKEKQDALLRALNGTRFVRSDEDKVVTDSRGIYGLELYTMNGKVTVISKVTRLGQSDRQFNADIPEAQVGIWFKRDPKEVTFRGLQFTLPGPHCASRGICDRARGTISDNGDTITLNVETTWGDGSHHNEVYVLNRDLQQ